MPVRALLGGGPNRVKRTEISPQHQKEKVSSQGIGVTLQSIYMQTPALSELHWGTYCTKVANQSL